MQKNKAELFQQFLSSPDYSSLQQTINAIPHLASLTQDKITNVKTYNGLIIRSSNDDNIHKAIKYGIWTTTFKNKSKLEELWNQYQERKVETFLFFSAVKSGHFQGVARLASGYNEETFPFWWQNQNGKFKGHFEIEWVFIKDINYKHFNGLKNREGEDITRSKDCDEISEETTKQMLNIFQNSKRKHSIFTSFEMFDNRQKQYLRNILTPEQEMWLMNEQMRALQLQQQYLYQISSMNMNQLNNNNNPTKAGINPYVNPNEEIKGGLMTNTNTGFQMNPVSKNKKYKEK